VIAAAKKNGVWPFTHFNRLQIAPPLITSDDDLRLGLAGIDAALDVADTYVA
jgi:taurine---2-oxoglutarate transaminase